MSRFILISIVFVALLGAGFFGFELTRDHETVYAPENVFGAEDETVLLINRVDELRRYSLLSEEVSNPILNEIPFEFLNLNSIHKIFISSKRPIVVFHKKSQWSNKEVSLFNKHFKDNRTELVAKGGYLVAFQNELNLLNGFDKEFFIDGDKKASGSVWNYRNEYKDWIRTDVYALENGLFKYQTALKYKSHADPVIEEGMFTTVLPENIQKYEFFERFYAAERDSVFERGLMNEWINKGYVKAKFNNEVFLVSDNRMQQTPALVLLEQSNDEDAIDYTSTIKSFLGFQLTNDFPSNEEKRIYILELEDKTIITETKALAQKIQLIYSLGETIGLNSKKRAQFFGDLPKSVNYRYIDKSLKKSITVSDKIIFEVSTLPPGESMIMQEASNWTKPLSFKNVVGFKPIKDHIRGGYSLFIYNKDGVYELLNTNGESVFNGELDTNLIKDVTSIDLYSNDKQQLLFTTASSINLLDLNGTQVGHFPYKPHHAITSPPSQFTWKGTMRFLFGTANGELITVNSSGQELNAVQATQGAIYEKPYALNIGGNLRGWFKNESGISGLAYLDKPIASEVIGKSKGAHYQKVASNVEGWFNEGESTYKLQMNAPDNNIPFGEGKLISVSKNNVITQKQNELFLYSPNGNLLRSQKLPFNEVGDAVLIYFNGKNYLGVFDFLENNFYLYDDEGLVNSFPKEARKFVEAVVDKDQGMLLVYTLINDTIVCYKYKIN